VQPRKSGIYGTSSIDTIQNWRVSKMYEDRKIQYKELNGVVYGTVSLPVKILGAWIDRGVTHIRFESEGNDTLTLTPLRFETDIVEE
jgi:hypothetical protein